MKKLSKVLFCCTALFILITGCSKKEEPLMQNTAEVSWSENFDGNEIKFSVKTAPSRAVSMSMATTEMMLALGLEERMAGTAFLEEELLPGLKNAYGKVEVLAEKWPSYEIFMSKSPDFVTGWPVPFTKRGIEYSNIVKNNIPIFIPNSMKEINADLETNFNDLLKFGEIFDCRERAENFVKMQKEKLSAIQTKLEKLPNKTVFIFDSEDGKPFTVFEGYTANILKLIGCENILSGKGVEKTWGQADWEEIVAGNPEVIIIVDYGVSIRNDDDFKGKVEKLKANPVLKDVSAVKNGKFIRVKLSEITPGVRTVDALERIASEIHGL
ncbi:ABC transporter substrate-binding protein [Treponema pedis]|nr:ABC transporter substrate-binding protein [Treponema pedis]